MCDEARSLRLLFARSCQSISPINQSIIRRSNAHFIRIHTRARVRRDASQRFGAERRDGSERSGEGVHDLGAERIERSLSRRLHPGTIQRPRWSPHFSNALHYIVWRAAGKHQCIAVFFNTQTQTLHSKDVRAATRRDISLCCTREVSPIYLSERENQRRQQESARLQIVRRCASGGAADGRRRRRGCHHRRRRRCCL